MKTTRLSGALMSWQQFKKCASGFSARRFHVFLYDIVLPQSAFYMGTLEPKHLTYGTWTRWARDTLSSQTPSSQITSSQTLSSQTECPKRPHKHKDPTNHGFWYPPYIGPWNQNVRSSCLGGLLGPYDKNVALHCSILHKALHPDQSWPGKGSSLNLVLDGQS